MEAQGILQTTLISSVVVGLVALFWCLYDALVAKPRKLRSVLSIQGINGPPPTLLLGNILEIKKARSYAAVAARTTPPAAACVGSPPTEHNCANSLFPFFQEWQKKYGDVFTFSMGNIQILVVTRQDIVKELTTCTSLNFGKPLYQAREHSALFGDSIVTSNGTNWAHQRRLLAPELYMDKVKGMSNLIRESAMTIIESWNTLIEEKGGIADIKVDPYLRRFSGYVISKACFGSSSARGEDIFAKLNFLAEITSKKNLSSLGIPGRRYLPTKDNRNAWALAKEIKELILKVVKERTEAGSEKDLLQKLIETARNSELRQDALDRFIVDNCKTMYFAGYESTAISAAWCLMLLAANHEWQERVRAEVLDVCKGQRLPDAESIQNMKTVHMVIQESLRLYPPVSVMSREVFEDMRFGDIVIPKGVNVWAFVLELHTDPEIWGNDSYEFNPQRFADGVAGACKHPQAYMPFGMGPRVCPGQNLAMAELKMLVALAVSHFSFTLSPTYVHSPVLRALILPRHGVHLHFRKLDEKVKRGSYVIV